MLHHRAYTPNFCFHFTGKEKDSETGYSYFGARYLDHELMTMWLSVDPLADKYPSISPYAYCAWNPVKLVDPTGNTIDISGLSEAEKAVYENSIKQLIKSPLFAYYYGELQSSTKTYKIQEGPGRGGEGSFEPKSNTISANLDNLCALSQEMFHAYQTDGGFYTSEDASVRETEGDLVSMLVMSDIGHSTGSYGTWANTFVKYQYDDYRETLAEESFILDFDKMVDDRINYYLNTENPPKSYIQPNSHKRPRALLKALENASNQYQQWKSNPSMKPSGKVVIRAKK
jgi:RHS repeat-associated protein